tara:strand:- start:185 stop:406 length:222 start_codon:yes stop_codon:yes gene_type:complete
MELSPSKYLDVRQSIDAQIRRIQTFAETLIMIGQLDHHPIENDPIALIGQEIQSNILNIEEALDDFASKDSLE